MRKSYVHIKVRKVDRPDTYIITNIKRNTM
jgi:hypothetical protein